MTGSVRKRGDKWYYSFEAARVDGKRKRIERVGGRTKKEAEAALRKALEDYENGEQLQKTNISVSDYMDLWFDAYVLLNCRYNTQRSYRLIIDKHIKPSLGILKLTSLTPGKLQDFINSKYLTGISKNHLNNIISLLSGSLNYSVHPMNFLKNNPMQYVKIPKYNNTKTTDKHKIITNDDFNAIIKRFPERSSFYIPLMIGYHTGCRIGEA
ncbi:Phage integrase family protein, partial [Candidatus Arthromitus sp. SFB-5]